MPIYPYDGYTAGSNWIRANQPVVVTNVSALRALDKTEISYAVTKGYYTAGDGGAGEYWYDSSDTSSVDNQGTVIVGSDGGRWRLRRSSPLRLSSFITQGSTGDHSANVMSACNSLGEHGGTLLVDAGLTVNILTSITIPPGVCLKGECNYPSIRGNNTINSIENSASQLRIASTATVTLSSGSAILNCSVFRYGILFPGVDSTLFAGTAISTGGDDVRIQDNLIIGFALAISSSGFQRVRITGNLLDNTSGIFIENCFDVPHVEGNHMWPFYTIEQYAGGVSGSSIKRSGTGYKICNVVDWGRITNNFCYAYYRGFHTATAERNVLMGNMADGESSYAGSIGFYCEGNHTVLVTPQAGGVDIACVVAPGTGGIVEILNPQFDSATTSAIKWMSGDIVLIGGLLRNVPVGIYVENSTGELLVEGTYFEGNVAMPLSFSVQNDNITFHPVLNYAAGKTIWAGIWHNRVIGEADISTSISLPMNGGCLELYSTTVKTITTITGGYPGRVIILRNTGPATITFSSGDGLNLPLGNVSLVTQQTITFLCVGVNAWVQA